MNLIDVISKLPTEILLYAGFKEELTPEEFAEIIENSKNNNSCDSPTACGEQGRTSHTLLLDTFIDNRKPTNITTEGNKSLVRKITNFLHISK